MRQWAVKKPYHLMTPAERTAARIAQNREIAEKTDARKTGLPPKQSTGEGTRRTPDDLSKGGGVIRKV